MKYFSSYKIEIVGICVCMFAYSSRKDKPVHTKLRMRIPWNQQEILERSKLRNKALSLNPVEGSFYSSETKHDRRLNLFVSAKMLQKQGHNSEKLSWVRVPTNMYSVARKLSKVKEQRQCQSFCFAGQITGTKTTNPKICPGFETWWRWFL
jgi:hypothetical protein